MQGATEYATIFSTGQHGRLYLCSHYHARGKTFHVYVLPEGEPAQTNEPNGPRNKSAVEVYGITGGQPGWSETYGWLHRGRWEQDFAALVEARREEIAAGVTRREQDMARAEAAERERKVSLLAAY